MLGALLSLDIPCTFHAEFPWSSIASYLATKMSYRRLFNVVQLLNNDDAKHVILKCVIVMHTQRKRQHMEGYGIYVDHSLPQVPLLHTYLHSLSCNLAF